MRFFIFFLSLLSMPTSSTYLYYTLPETKFMFRRGSRYFVKLAFILRTTTEAMISFRRNHIHHLSYHQNLVHRPSPRFIQDIMIQRPKNQTL
ncbi:hypothetical protein B0H65DRAFT_462521 [Neurospora tetraspora]|uniref:Secreted protein n=1 Tax=Neurospora tetraspora TaxID=94610 RepID=A0AAE0JJ12_9PEZI|nr:hypothetical protein B0H65DRAFT_462521 [Neurospora tetraspora]